MNIVHRIFSYLFVQFFKTFPSLYKIKILRRFFTDNYQSGLIAFGEQFYRLSAIGPKWVYANVENADKHFLIKNNTKLPFKDNSADILYSAHMIEHLVPEDLDFFMSECSRILKPGGYLRFEAPDAEKMINGYLKNDRALLDSLKFLHLAPKYQEDYISVLGSLTCYVKNGVHFPVSIEKELFDEKLASLSLEKFEEWLQTLQTDEQKKTMGHNNIIYYEKMKNMCLGKNFINTWNSKYGVTNIPDLHLDNLRRRHIDCIQEGPHREIHSIYFEAQKNLLR